MRKSSFEAGTLDFKKPVAIGPNFTQINNFKSLIFGICTSTKNFPALIAFCFCFCFCFHFQTRISDWREGALDSRHFINKLCEADAQLKQYEESAAPPGWTCHWDRYCISLVLCPGG